MYVYVLNMNKHAMSCSTNMTWPGRYFLVAFITQPTNDNECDTDTLMIETQTKTRAHYCLKNSTVTAIATGATDGATSSKQLCACVYVYVCV